jgi:hypothetical protein
VVAERLAIVIVDPLRTPSLVLATVRRLEPLLPRLASLLTGEDTLTAPARHSHALTYAHATCFHACAQRGSRKRALTVLAREYARLLAASCPTKREANGDEAEHEDVQQRHASGHSTHPISKSARTHRRA